MSDETTHVIPVAYVRDIVELSARWSVRPEELLAGLPLRVESLTDPATRVPIPVCAEIVARAERLTAEPALAFHAGTQMRVSVHGFLGFAAMTSGTVREALALATRFASTRTTIIGLSFYVEDGTASIVVEERAELGALREFAVVSLIVGLWRLGESLTGRQLDGSAECSFPAPAYLEELGESLTGRISFGRPANRLLFPAALLDLPLTSADPLATQLARAECERELAAIAGAGLPARVRAVILACPDRVPSIVEVARELHLSTRTLKRRLADRDMTFTAIADDVRSQRAVLLLANRELAIGEIATRLGYTELPNFTRAFRRWTGTTPAAYRAERLAAGLLKPDS